MNKKLWDRDVSNIDIRIILRPRLHPLFIMYCVSLFVIEIRIDLLLHLCNSTTGGRASI
jgi:hypothetical protein